MSIEDRLAEIQRALNQARTWLDCTEALVKQLVAVEKPSLEMLARVASLVPDPESTPK
jgi:hypothetical protein